jgi:uncharacterized protein
MRLVDLNLLIYAVNSDAPFHQAARKWWEASLSDGKAVAFAWVVVLGFLRITNNARIMPHPLTDRQTLDIMEEWLSQPSVVILAPTERHWPIFRQLIADSGMAGNLTTDAHLAALAIEHGATLYSTDHDFSRFDGLRWRNPIAS